MEKAIPIDQVLRHAPGVDGRITVEQPEPDTEPFTIESFISALEERNRVELTPEAQALVDRVRDEKDCTPSLLLALAETGVVPVSPDEIRNQFEKWGVEPEPLFPPDIQKLNVLIAQARELKRRVVDAERYDHASTIRAREKAAMRRRAELLTEWAGEAELVAMVEEIENLRATVRRLRG